jgi:DNA invertase Pin-like site-specific DNA recombinase
MANEASTDKTKKPRKKRTIVKLSEHKRLAAEKAVEQRMQQNPNIFKLPISKRNIDDLTDYFTKQQESLVKILPKEKRRYVIYIRKSTDDEAKQVRSLEDQESECLELAQRMVVDIRPEDIISESGSAKKSGNRPIFDRMVEGFKLGKYHGLISWSPDRLSRNMKEAGELIEMVDLEQIQDLAFRTYQFENNPNGKMLLGILFATSKQYSDKLSVDVSRGTSGNIRDGKYNGVVKKGYYVDKDSGHFIPDGYNWQLLREAASDFGKEYAGKGTAAARLDYGLLRNKVICDFCDSNMQFQHQEIKRGKNKGMWLISWYCRNRQCIRHNDKAALEKYGKRLKRSIRALYVVPPIEEMLKQCTKKSEEAYKYHIDKLEVKVAQEKAIAKRKLNEAKTSLTHNNKQYAKYQDFQSDYPKEYAKHHAGKLEYHQNLINVAGANIKAANAEIEKLKYAIPTPEKFYELTKSYLKTLNKTRDLVERDTVLNEVVLNLRAGDDSVSVIKLNKPYDMLVDLSKISTGRG